MSGTLAEKTALVVGAGALGGPALLALAAAGVGRLVLVDGAAVGLDDLAGQPLLVEADRGRRKVDAAAARLGRLYPACAVEPLDLRLEAPPPGLLERADVVLDASNHLATQLRLSDAAVAAGRPLVHGAALRTTAQVLAILPGRTCCLRCLFEEAPPPGAAPRAAEAGLVAAVAGLAGGLMAAEALRLLAGAPLCHAGRVLVYEVGSARARAVPVRPRPDCPACGGRA